MALVDILTEQDEVKSCTYPITPWHRKWSEYSGSEYTWAIYQLEHSKINQIPEGPGVYSLCILPAIAGHPSCSYLMYIGKTNSLKRRFREYLSSERKATGRPKIYHLLNKYSDYLCFCYIEVSPDHLTQVEDQFLIAYVPPANDQYPAEIRAAVSAF